MAVLKKRKREAAVYDRLIETMDEGVSDVDKDDWEQFRDGFQAMRRLLHAQGLILTRDGIEKGTPR